MKICVSVSVWCIAWCDQLCLKCQCNWNFRHLDVLCPNLSDRLSYTSWTLKKTILLRFMTKSSQGMLELKRQRPLCFSSLGSRTVYTCKLQSLWCEMLICRYFAYSTTLWEEYVTWTDMVRHWGMPWLELSDSITIAIMINSDQIVAIPIVSR